MSLPLSVLSLFAGIGGFDLGLERTGGFKTAAFCEIEPHARSILQKHWPEVPCYEDINDLTADRLLADGVVPDVIVGGFPCQDISLAGRMAGIEGSKSGLWSEMARLIAATKPAFVIIENSPVLRSRGLDQMLWAFAALGYDAEWHCIPLNALGAPHRRDRVWIIAYPAGFGDGASQGEVQAGRNLLEHNPRWAAEPAVPRVDDGFPDRVDRHKRLGNAVSPYVPELIGRAILAAIADTHRNGGDSTKIEAPFMSGSGARSAIAQRQSAMTKYHSNRTDCGQSFAAFVTMAVDRLGQMEVARICCVSFPTVDRWARGVTAPHPIARPSVYAALGKALA